MSPTTMASMNKRLTFLDKQNVYATQLSYKMLSSSFYRLPKKRKVQKVFWINFGIVSLVHVHQAANQCVRPIKWVGISHYLLFEWIGLWSLVDNSRRYWSKFEMQYNHVQPSMSSFLFLVKCFLVSVNNEKRSTLRFLLSDGKYFRKKKSEIQHFTPVSLHRNSVNEDWMMLKTWMHYLLNAELQLMMVRYFQRYEEYSANKSAKFR